MNEKTTLTEKETDDLKKQHISLCAEWIHLYDENCVLEKADNLVARNTVIRNEKRMKEIEGLQHQGIPFKGKRWVYLVGMGSLTALA